MDETRDSQEPPQGSPNEPQQTPETPSQAAPPPGYDPAAPPIPEPAPATAPPAFGDLTKDAKMWGMFCHLAALAMFTSIPFANVLGPLIIWLIKKDEMAFVNDQGKESLNFQISVSIYAIACSVLICLGGLGFILLGALAIADLVFIIIAAIKANSGEVYRYPLCIRLVK